MFSLFEKNMYVNLLELNHDEKINYAIKGKKQALNILRKDNNINILIEVAKHGRDEDYTYLINATTELNDINFYILQAYIQKCSNKSLDKLILSPYKNKLMIYILKRNRYSDYIASLSSNNKEVKLYVISKIKKIYLHNYIDDPDPDIRVAIASRLDKTILSKLVYDVDSNVRAEVAKSGFDEYLDILINDESYNVRAEVAKFGRKKDIPILINDSSFIVKLSLVRHIKSNNVVFLEKHFKKNNIDIISNINSY